MNDALKAHKLVKKEQRVANHAYHEKKRRVREEEQLCLLVDPNFWSVQVEQEELPALLRKKPAEVPVANVDGQKCYVNPDVKVRRA